MIRLTLTQADDWHVHFRDGALLAGVLPHTAGSFARAMVMPNLSPPVATVAQALAYYNRIMASLPKYNRFKPLMTLYLTDHTTQNDIRLAKESGLIYGIKFYPKGATTHAKAGVSHLMGQLAVLKTMAALSMPLLVHGEVSDANVDVFDREAVFIETVLAPLLKTLPTLKIVLEHITTQHAVDFISTAPPHIAATVTPQHLLLNRNALFQHGLRPHYYCLPVLKRERHRQALLKAVTSGNPKFFLGTDSAPHIRSRKEANQACAGVYTAPFALALYATAFESVGALARLEAFTSHHGPDFYGLPRNQTQIQLIKKPWQVPEVYRFGTEQVVPLFAKTWLDWQLESTI